MALINLPLLLGTTHTQHTHAAAAHGYNTEFICGGLTPKIWQKISSTGSHFAPEQPGLQSWSDNQVRSACHFTDCWLRECEAADVADPPQPHTELPFSVSAASFLCCQHFSFSAVGLGTMALPYFSLFFFESVCHYLCDWFPTRGSRPLNPFLYRTNYWFLIFRKWSQWKVNSDKMHSSFCQLIIVIPASVCLLNHRIVPIHFFSK